VVTIIQLIHCITRCITFIYISYKYEGNACGIKKF